MISVIIPAHKEGKTLSGLLAKLLSFENNLSIEILVALSPESKCVEINDQDSGMITYVKCKQKGRACQMNEATKMAKGDVFAFLHADVTPPPTFFLDIEHTVLGGYDAGFFSYRFDNKSFLLRINASFTRRDGIFTGGGDQCLFIRKDTFENLGKFDEQQLLMEDFELFERMKKHKVPYTIVQNDLVVSARKYEHNSYLRVNLTNLLLVVLFKFGYQPEGLKRLHNRLLRLP